MIPFWVLFASLLNFLWNGKAFVSLCTTESFLDLDMGPQSLVDVLQLASIVFSSVLSWRSSPGRVPILFSSSFVEVSHYRETD